jgi:hypothetical protein
VFNFFLASIKTEDFRFRHARPGLPTAREAFAVHQCSEHAVAGLPLKQLTHVQAPPYYQPCLWPPT